MVWSWQVIAATNRADTLDPALMRSGRLDRKIEFPHPNEDARAKILQIHSRKMNVSPDVNFEELARSSDDFNAAQLKVGPFPNRHPITKHTLSLQVMSSHNKTCSLLQSHTATLY